MRETPPCRARGSIAFALRWQTNAYVFDGNDSVKALILEERLAVGSLDREGPSRPRRGMEGAAIAWE